MVQMYPNALRLNNANDSGRELTSAMADDLTAQVRALQQQSVPALKEFIFPRSASIARSVSDDVGEHWGSGSYVEAGGRVYLLTNRHVAMKATETTLTHIVVNGEEMAPLAEQFAVAGEADVALMPVRPEVWSRTDKLAMPLGDFDAGPPAADELLMLVGFPWRGSRFSALQGAVRSRAMPYIAQREHAVEDDGIHFWLKYRPGELKDETGGPAEFTEPKGLSGSLVWNTGLVHSVRGGTAWSTHLLRPVGLLMGWRPNEQALQVVRLDVVRQIIRKMLDDEA